ncbi:MAG: hypothetical protein QXK78_03185 [Candidatus Bathyarchaeia archaeon]
MFFALQVIVFLILLLLSEKIKAESKFSIPHNVSAITIKVFYVLLIIGGLATTFMNFRDTLLYNSIISLTPLVLILLITSSFSSKLTLATAIMWHYMLMAPEIGGDFVSVTEGVHMTRTMVFYGRWLPELAHNPSYNPFPTMAFVRAALSLLTGLPWYNQGTALLTLVIIIVAFDLAVHIFSSKIFSDSRVGIIAIFIFALTPYLSVTSHAYQVPATLLWFLSVYMLIQRLSSFQRKYSILAMLLFASAILTHTTAYIEMILPIVLLSLKYFGRIINLKSPEMEYPHIKTMALLIIVIGLTRFVFESLYAYYVGKMFFNTVGDLVVRIFLGEEIEIKPTLYEYGGVPFYQAFLWSLTASLACALIIQGFLKKSVNPVLLSLFLTASIFMGLGYLTAVIVRGATQIHRGSYAAFMLLVPSAALTMKKIMDAKSKPLVITLSLIMLLSSCLALNDPELSPNIAMRVRGIPEEARVGSLEDLIKASYITNFAKDLRVINNITLYSEDTLVYERVTAYGEKIKVVYSKIRDALYKTLYINGYTFRDKPIFTINCILPEEFEERCLAFNVIYSSGREVFFMPGFQLNGV